MSSPVGATVGEVSRSRVFSREKGETVPRLLRQNQSIMSITITLKTLQNKKYDLVVDESITVRAH
jgi:hypothetical protein